MIIRTPIKQVTKPKILLKLIFSLKNNKYSCGDNYDSCMMGISLVCIKIALKSIQ